MRLRPATVACLWPIIWLGLSVAALAQRAPPSGQPRPVTPGDVVSLLAPSTAQRANLDGTLVAMPALLPTIPTPAAIPDSAAQIGAVPPGGPAAAPNSATAAPSTAPRPPLRLPPVQGLDIEAGSGRLVSLAAPAASVFAADQRVAEVRPASPTSLFVLGVAPGRTTIAAIDDNGAAIAQYDVIVRTSSYTAVQAQSAIARLLPGRGVHVATQSNGLLITGTVGNASDAEQAVQTAHDFVGPGQTVENRLSVLGSQQVNLRVRIAEVSRSVIRQLGINWSNLAGLGKYAAFGMVTRNPLANTTVAASTAVASYVFPTADHFLDLNAVIDAMAQDQLVHVLAEPNLTAMSGETASFLVGGEFPIPVAMQNNQISIDFKQYGVSLAFVPTVISGGRISMKVRPEVSALTTQGAVQLGVGNSTIQVPALTVRRAETTVELASGQSFAIAGLLQDNTTMTGNALPGIGELPILGALFRSDSFQRNETELVILVTPYLVTGVSNPGQLKLPTDGWKPPSDLERLLLLRQSARDPGTVAAVPHIPGDAGFVVR
jgi:pilus assembly protein CpaC